MNNKNRKEVIIRDTGKYSLAQYTTEGIGVVTAIFLRRFLDPYFMGIWSLLKVTHSYFSYLGLGVNSAAAYRIPFYRGKKDETSEEETRDTAFSFLFMVSIVSSLCLVGAAVVLRPLYPTEVIIGLLALAIYIILQRLYSFYVVILRAYKSFSVLAKSLLFDAVLNLALVLLLVRHFKIYGLYIMIALVAVLNTLFVHRLARYKIEFNFRFKRLKSLVSYGFPLLISGFLGEILRTVDRIMIVKMLGVTFVGYYSIAIMTKGYIYGLPNNLGIVTIPHMQEVYGRQERIDDIKKFVTLSAEAISYILAPILGLIFIIGPLLVRKLLPQYVPGILALQILLLDTYFHSCSPQAQQFLISLGKQARMIPISIAAIVLNILFNYTFIKMGWGISGVALGTSLASLFGFVAFLSYAMKHFASLKEILAFILRVLFPLFYIGAVVLSSTYLVRVQNPYLGVGVKLIILGAVSTPLFFYIDRKTHILRIMFGSIAAKFKTEK